MCLFSFTDSREPGVQRCFDENRNISFGEKGQRANEGKKEEPNFTELGEVCVTGSFFLENPIHNVPSAWFKPGSYRWNERKDTTTSTQTSTTFLKTLFFFDSPTNCFACHRHSKVFFLIHFTWKMDYLCYLKFEQDFGAEFSLSVLVAIGHNYVLKMRDCGFISHPLSLKWMFVSPFRTLKITYKDIPQRPIVWEIRSVIIEASVMITKPPASNYQNG